MNRIAIAKELLKLARELTAAPSEKQISYAVYLLGEKGYSTKWMNSQFKDLGAGMRERSGKVEDWLKGMNSSEISKLINHLKSVG